MGQNLALNTSDHGLTVAVYNRTIAKVDQFVGDNPEKKLVGTHSIEALCASLSSPRIIMFMVQAGEAVDQLIQAMIPHLSPGDVLVDGGNSLFRDTSRRVSELQSRGIYFVGMGVSGGEDGARHGPSLMPGGASEAWPHIKNIFQSISAQVDNEPCCHWIGSGGAGHYVKMVHNGIEYGDMQLISEAYQLLRFGLGIPVNEIANIFDEWQNAELESYLIEITRNILKVKDTDGKPLIDNILDSAGQKGTGKWTGIDALENGMPLTLITESVFARYLSTLKQQRVAASTILAGPKPDQNIDQSAFIQRIREALYASKIISYAQGFMLMQQASDKYQWQLSPGNIALVWRGGCIIRSRFLTNINQAYQSNPELANLMLDDFFKDKLEHAQDGWRQSIQFGVAAGIPLPAFSSALAFYDGYRCAALPANLLQAQRDYFGAHTYERIDKPRGEFFHTDWINHPDT